MPMFFINTTCTKIKQNCVNHISFLFFEIQILIKLLKNAKIANMLYLDKNHEISNFVHLHINI